ncbi:MAG: sulfite exporter TauE/SafE family protein [Ignavibacteriae bacterium]|nr:sulfite exporter TauE/SafE family protein [Ignavibacteriota bacterium]
MTDPFTLSFILVLVFLVAALYSSVGHGGASGYLAVLSFFAFVPAEMSSTALVLNLLVAGVGAYHYGKAGHLSWKLTWPFLITSIPLAFIGGLLKVSDITYYLLLAAVLLAAAIRLATAKSVSQGDFEKTNLKLSVALPVGAGIGILSGIVGVGGGIFLSPLMIFMNWADPKQTAAVSALFIWVNSLAGLGGRFLRDAVELHSLWPLVFAAFFGGLLGSYVGANKFTGLMLRRVLGVVLMIASFKMAYAVL